MRSACRAVELGLAAQWWFEHWMRMYTLPAMLLGRVHFDSGTFVTWLPTDVPDEEAQHFETGGKYRWEPGGCWPRNALSEFVAEQLTRRHDLTWLFEDPVSRPGDAWFAEARIQNAITSQERIYYLISRDASSDMIAKTIDIILGSQPTVGVCVSLEPGSLVNGLRASQLASLSREIIALTVGAYDGEGFIAWSLRGT
jgi:hypothetical protein